MGRWVSGDGGGVGWAEVSEVSVPCCCCFRCGEPAALVGWLEPSLREPFVLVFVHDDAVDDECHYTFDPGADVRSDQHGETGE